MKVYSIGILLVVLAITACSDDRRSVRDENAEASPVTVSQSSEIPIATTDDKVMSRGDSTTIDDSSPRLHEIKSRSNSSIAAPEPCVRNLRAFLEYLSRSEPDIASDRLAQERWLSSELRRAMDFKVSIEDAKEKENPGEKREYPNNGTFVGAWDYPSTYKLIGGRLYNVSFIFRGERKKRTSAVIDVEYEWLKGTNYEGDKILKSFIFVTEDGNCKIDDIYTFRGEFQPAESLNSYLLQHY